MTTEPDDRRDVLSGADSAVPEDGRTGTSGPSSEEPASPNGPETETAENPGISENAEYAAGPAGPAKAEDGGDGADGADGTDGTGGTGGSGGGGNNGEGENKREGEGESKGKGKDEGNGKQRRQLPFWVELPVLLVVSLGLALLIKTFLVQAFYIPSESMQNTLQVGDRVLVNKVVYHLRDIKRGDTVVFRGTDSWDPEVQVAEPTNPLSKVLRVIGSAFGAAPSEKDYIKRVIGIPGDHVKCCDAQGRITVNGVPLNEGSYVYIDPVTHEQDKPSDKPFDVTVPEGGLWVMGDHRSRSADSRYHRGDPGGGSIPTDNVIGRAFVIIWPVGRVDTLPTPKTFERPAAALANATGDALPAVPAALGVAAVMPIAALRLRHRRRRRQTAAQD